MKDGWKTSEFWVTLLVQMTGILVLTGVIDPGQSVALNDAFGQGWTFVADTIANGGVIIGMIVTAFGYNKGRAEVKKDG